MTWSPPPWLLATDAELVNQFVEAKRGEVRALYAAIEGMESSFDFARLRWKLSAMIHESQFNEAQLEKAHPPKENA